MWNEILEKMRGADLAIVKLARRPDLDQETAFTICQLIDNVGSQVKEDWDWDWLEGERDDYRSLIEIPLLKKAWRLLLEKDWLSLQTTNSVDKRISTISPLAGLTNLKSLVLQNNLIQDLEPLSELTGLTYLNLLQNRISDLAPLRHLQLLEKLWLGGDPVASLRVLEELPNLRELALSPDQLARFTECKSLPGVRSLCVEVEGAVENFKQWPDMPSLKVLKIWGVKDLEGIERFGALETLDTVSGMYSDLTPLSQLKRLTHCDLSSSKPLDAQSLARLHALRRLVFNCPEVRGLVVLSALPALHEVHLDQNTTCDAAELKALRAEAVPWDTEFKEETKAVRPSLELEVVDQRTFDYYDSKADYGVRADECQGDGMLSSERKWLLDQIREALSVTFEEGEGADFYLPYTAGRRRTERIILYSVVAYEAFRNIVLAVQRILCQTRNAWIIWFQSCIHEGPNAEEVPQDWEDFILWIYPDKIVATRENAKVVRKLIEWKS